MMEFKYLPTEIQVIAALTLRGKIEINDERTTKEPVVQLAREVREAFMTLYYPGKVEPSQTGSD